MAHSVFLAVEGVNDGGAIGRSIGTVPNDPGDEGVLQPLLRRAARTSPRFVGQKVTMLPLGDVMEPEEAIGRRARKASALARFAGCSLLVFHQDVDGPADGIADDRMAAWTAVSEAVAEGARIAQLNGEGLPAAACILAAPLRTIETWLLADVTALATVAEVGSEDLSGMLGDPEGLWGTQRDRDSLHPKLLFRRAAGGPNRRARMTHYRAAAAAVSLDVVEARCPISFAAFRQAVAHLVA